MLRNFLTVGSWTMLSRVLGLIRDQLLAIFLGAGPLQDAYLTALRLPNMFRRLFGEGAFNAAFVPMFTAKYEKEGQAAALQFAGQALSALVAWLVVLTVLAEIFMPSIIHVIAWGYTGFRFTEAVALTRITFPYMVLICAAALVSGVLNGRGKFGAASAAYVTFNIIGIVAILAGAYLWHNTAVSSAWGVTISGFVQLGALYWAAHRLGIAPHLVRPSFSKDIKALLRRMGPGLVGSGVTQLNLTIDGIIASQLPAGAPSLLYFADRINQLPLGVLGSAAGTALLPLLTKHIANNDRESVHTSLNRAIDYTLLLTLPAMMGLISLAPYIMAALFRFGHFTTEDAILSGQSLQAYALGLPAFILIKVLSPGFFASGDTATPVRIGFFTLGLNLVLNLLLYRPLAHIGPPLASTLAAFVNVGILAIILHRRGMFSLDPKLRNRSLCILGASLLMALWIVAARKFLMPNLLMWHGLERFIGVMSLISFGGLVYVIALDRLKIIKIRDVKAALQRRIARKRSG
ncbi:murein biosynthesis integral membrane protein MurJ [Swingsia samuiensis]|uniref:Probable lipid II flippase MurJ n=1 Tax=Swingsia samuiensis TaxID=1293412 RepID=A0A4Y6UMF1_9PROT|nr:murein biosynthesis integral membrane protein MurJ [Swingsia samuiensis]QDH17571.1 murein biosynthesis integral membrane protein MurJ [Swingsia samuiensis]